MYRRSFSLLSLLALVCLTSLPAIAQKRAMTWEDMMHFRSIQEVQLSDDGSVVAFAAVPDRGDSEVIVVSTDGRTKHRIPFGRAPQVTPSGRFVAARIEPSFAASERAKNGNDKPKPGMALLDVQSGEQLDVEMVDRFAFSPDGRWLAILRHQQADSARADTTNGSENEDSDWTGEPLILRDVLSGTEHTVMNVGRMTWSSHGPLIAYTVAGDSLSTALFVADLSADAPRHEQLHAAPGHEYDRLTWSGEHAPSERLAFLTRQKPEKEEDQPAEVFLWEDGDLRSVNISGALPEEWTLPLAGALSFSRDGERLFIGARPQHEREEETPADTTEAALYDLDHILDERTLDVWHVDDPRIVTQQKQVWEREREATFPIVHHIEEVHSVRVGSPERQPTRLPDNPRTLLATDPTPYFPFQTWEGFFLDLYAVDLATGDETLIAERIEGGSELSPDGRFVVYYEDESWHAIEVESGLRRGLTASLPVDFSDEDHDYPRPAPGYGIGGWVGSDAVLIYDKFDIWQVPLDGSTAVRLTDGRPEHRIFRIVKTDPDREAFEPGEEVLLSSYHDRRKNYGFYRGRIGESGTERLIEEDRKFDFVAMAKHAPTILYTREGFDEFPDLWATGPDFRRTQKLTEVNPQMEDLKWGSTELVEWRSLDGAPLQGVVIKPEDYDPTRTYPVVVYYYRFFSQRLHEFNRPQINHRPAFALYTGDDYVVFLPDIVFEVGRPGLSATKSLVPGVQKLIDMGIADPDRIGLHGHSWSGYQTAFVVTQTDIFRTAIAGAPVSNMTSAYSGIRWGSGLARMFQYEMQQSRLGASMWDARDRYIENSPVFYADRINTPLLIIHGDDDGAVPWYQSIEMYLAMRRLGKEAVFLQYRGEDHHPAAYPNKLDWAMRMKQWFDHYLKDEPAAWIEEGEPYAGK